MKIDKWKLLDFVRENGGVAKSVTAAKHFRVKSTVVAAVATELVAAGLCTVDVKSGWQAVRSKRGIKGAARRVKNLYLYCEKK